MSSTRNLWRIILVKEKIKKGKEISPSLKQLIKTEAEKARREGKSFEEYLVNVVTKMNENPILDRKLPKEFIDIIRGTKVVEEK